MQVIKPKLIGLCGYSRSGKDTIGEYLDKGYGIYDLALAEQVKKTAAELFGCDDCIFYDENKKNKPHYELYGLTPTQVAQFVGTEMVRDGLAKLVGKEKAERHWITVLDRLYDLEDTTDYHCITDVRFLNEYNWIKEKEGTIIQVVRPGYSGGIGLKEHRSDTELGDMNTSETAADFVVINDGTKEELYERVDVIMQQLGFEKHN